MVVRFVLHGADNNSFLRSVTHLQILDKESKNLPQEQKLTQVFLILVVFPIHVTTRRIRWFRESGAYKQRAGATINSPLSLSRSQYAVNP